VGISSPVGSSCLSGSGLQQTEVQSQIALVLCPRVLLLHLFEYSVYFIIILYHYWLSS